MPAKGLLRLSFLAVSMVASASSFAQEQPRSMLGNFDLKSVVLSPVPLGPPSQFEPSAVAAEPETKPETTPTAAAEPDKEPAVAPKPDRKPIVAKSEAAPRKVTSSKPRQKSAVAARKPKANPLDSYARDAGRQTWPCTGGGICAWTQPR
jgi:outer membrane biosynthesis protein TonB